MLKGILKYKHYILLLLSLGLLTAMVITIDVGVFFSQVRSISLSTIILWLGIYGFTWGIRAVRLFYLSDKLITLWTSFRLQVSAFALNLAYPAKMGDLLIASFLKKYIGGRYQESVALMLHLRLLDLMTLAAIVLLFIAPVTFSIAQPYEVPREINLLFWILLAAGVVFVAGLIWLQNLEWRQALQRYLPQKVLRIKPLFKFLISFHKLDRVYLVTLVSSLVIWFLEASTIALIARELDPQINFVPLLLAMAVGNLLKVLPLFPGGLGTYEAGFILILSLYGVSPEISVTLSITDHLLKKLVNLVLGFPSYLLWYRNNPEAAGAGDWSHLKP